MWRNSVALPFRGTTEETMMKPLIQVFVEQLTDADKLAIIKGYEQFQKDGVIGDEPIRRFAVDFMDSIQTTSNVVMWMQRLAFECYKYFATRYLRLAEISDNRYSTTDLVRPSERIADN